MRSILFDGNLQKLGNRALVGRVDNDARVERVALGVLGTHADFVEGQCRRQ